MVFHWMKMQFIWLMRDIACRIDFLSLIVQFVISFESNHWLVYVLKQRKSFSICIMHNYVM